MSDPFPEVDPDLMPTTNSTKLPDEPLPRGSRGRWNFLTRHVRAWTMIIAGAIIALLIWAVASNVSEVAKQARKTQARVAADALYAAELRTYDLAVHAHDMCAVFVEYDAVNRGQHETAIWAFEQTKQITPPTYHTGIDLVVGIMRSGQLLSTPPLKLEDCPPKPVAPAVPDHD